MFDPETGKLVDRDALRSIQVNAAGPTRGWVKVDREADHKTVQSFNQETGQPNGWDREHGNGAQSCEAVVPAVHVNLTANDN